PRAQDRRPPPPAPRRAGDHRRHPVLLHGLHRRVPYVPDPQAARRGAAHPRGAPVIPDAYFARFETKKYRSENPVQRTLIRRFVAALHELFSEAGPVSSVLEVGVGEGFISGYLSEQLPSIRFTGVELDGEDVARARRLFPRLDVREGSAYDLSTVPDLSQDGV